MSSSIVGENICLLRKNAGFTQGNLAQFIGVDQSMISKIEKGERSLSADTLEKLATLFGVSVKQMEEWPVVAPRLSYAIKSSEFTKEEMEAVAAVNKIALNADFLCHLLREH